jgi:hypothetical protein
VNETCDEWSITNGVNETKQIGTRTHALGSRVGAVSNARNIWLFFAQQATA